MSDITTEQVTNRIPYADPSLITDFVQEIIDGQQAFLRYECGREFSVSDADWNLYIECLIQASVMECLKRFVSGQTGGASYKVGDNISIDKSGQLQNVRGIIGEYKQWVNKAIIRLTRRGIQKLMFGP